jgi:hypothetical protein
MMLVIWSSGASNVLTINLTPLTRESMNRENDHMINENDIETHQAGFVAALDKARAEYFKLNFPNQNCAAVVVRRGRKYAKICTDTSVHSFVNLKNGDILKAASFKAPAPNGARGSIFALDFGLSCVGPFGAIYINGPNIGFRHKTTPPRMPADRSKKLTARHV